jgi:hypothetical protein
MIDNKEGGGGRGCQTSLDVDYTGHGVLSTPTSEIFFQPKLELSYFAKKREENVCDVKYHVQDTTV